MLVLQIVATLALEPANHRALVEQGLPDVLSQLLLPSDEWYYTNHSTKYARFVKHHAARSLVYLGLQHRVNLRFSVYDILTGQFPQRPAPSGQSARPATHLCDGLGVLLARPRRAPAKCSIGHPPRTRALSCLPPQAPCPAVHWAADAPRRTACRVPVARPVAWCPLLPAVGSRRYGLPAAIPTPPRPAPPARGHPGHPCRSHLAITASTRSGATQRHFRPGRSSERKASRRPKAESWPWSCWGCYATKGPSRPRWWCRGMSPAPRSPASRRVRAPRTPSTPGGRLEGGWRAARWLSSRRVSGGHK